MDTSSINRLDLPPAPAPVTGASVPARATPAPAASAKEDNTARPPSKSDVKKSVDEINRFLEDNSEVRFSIDEDSGFSVVKVIDTETKKVLQQFPSEQSLEIGKRLNSKQGLLIDSKA